MSHPVYPPELIIALSRNRVSVQVMVEPSADRPAWKNSYQVQGLFSESQLCAALDAALDQHPALFDKFREVAVLLLDRPNVTIPQFYSDQGQWDEIARKYISVKAGDALVAETAAGEVSIAYSLPTNTRKALEEYYAGAGYVHVTTVVWNAISQHLESFAGNTTRLFFCIIENSLLILSATGPKLTFSNLFYVQDQDDVTYYVIACSRMIRAQENWWLTIRNEYAGFDRPGHTYFNLDHHLELPDLQTLIARYRSCVS